MDDRQYMFFYIVSDNVGDCGSDNVGDCGSDNGDSGDDSIHGMKNEKYNYGGQLG